MRPVRLLGWKRVLPKLALGVLSIGIAVETAFSLAFSSAFSLKDAFEKGVCLTVLAVWGFITVYDIYQIPPNSVTLATPSSADNSDLTPSSMPLQRAPNGRVNLAWMNNQAVAAEVMEAANPVPASLLRNQAYEGYGATEDPAAVVVENPV